MKIELNLNLRQTLARASTLSLIPLSIRHLQPPTPPPPVLARDVPNGPREHPRPDYVTEKKKQA